jgi:hypothetical protein
MPYIPYAERAVEYFSGNDAVLRPRDALDAFHVLTGKYKDNDEWYEERSRLFFDYLVFDHPSPPFRNVMHRYFVDQSSRIRRENQVEVYRGFLTSHPSLFDILKVGRSDVVLKDLIGQGHFRVRMPEAAYSFNEGIIISARIIPFSGGLILGRGILLHPEQASIHILRLVDALRKERLLGWKSIFLLARMKLQHDMSPSFKLASVYSPRSFLIRRDAPSR